MKINQQFLKKVLLIAGITLLITTGLADDNTENSMKGNIENGALIVTLRVNYIDSENFSIVIKNNANHMLVPLDDLKAFNIKDEYLASASIDLNDIRYVNLNLLPGTNYHLDEETLALEIKFSPNQMKLQQFNAIEIPEKVISGKPISGAFLNYDLTFTDTSDTKSLAGFQELNYFCKYGTLSNSIVMRTVPINSSFSKKKNFKRDYNIFTRLETNWTFDNVENIARWRIGDSLTSPADWSNSTRFIGLQYATNFSIRPNLITHPLLEFAGKSELPSTLDVYANASSIYHGESKIGDFNVFNLPVITGRGDLVVKTQDITGKIQTVTIPYYVAPVLLAKGLSDFSFATGIQRQNFAIESNEYQYFITSADYMQGMSDYWTSGIHFESLKNFGTIGTTNNIQIGNYGVITASLASNLHNINNAQRALIGYSYESSGWDFNANLSKNGNNYYDIYNYPLVTSSEISYQMSTGYNHETLGSISVNFLSFAIDTTERKSKRLQIISTSYQRDITQNTFFNITAGTDLNRKHQHTFAYITFSMNLGGSKSASISNSYHNKYNTQQINFSAPVSTPLGFGYSANLMKSKTTDYNLQFNRNGQIGDAALYLYKYNKNLTSQLEFKGSIVSLDKDFYFTRPINDSLALVKVGTLKNVAIYNNNLITGYTNKDGKVLIPNVLPYISSEIRLDDETLPLDTEFDSLTLNIAPKWKNAVVVDFGVTIVNSVEMVLVDGNKKVISFDKIVTVEGLKEELFVGYEGRLYIHNIKDLRTLKGKACQDDDCCHFEAPINNDFNTSDLILDLGEVVCK
ncbi:fimbria/pilus outer membrane usher protein [Rickettsia endosymbiont of Halotydeus destructor]|uniref:fimbria/pilus outer membrane usher protein n=1 Tax=Rickettsia endosymbiont of Halotydeus destructor TaxID=2996754 RepID=UPI003BB1AE7E